MYSAYIPYGRQLVDEEDISAVVEVLRSDWLTTGPKVAEFETAMTDYTGAKYAVAVSNGTAALHAAMHAIGIGPGNEVIVPAITFAATANSVLYQGGIPVFADVESDTLLLDPGDVENKITSNTKAIAAVDYAGQPCDYDALKEIARRHDLFLISDACHALGAEYKGRKAGNLADMTVFSFHPVKHITTGEGGMIVTDRKELADKMRRFRNHGIDSDHRLRESQGTWYYEMEVLGYNYRITDIQCALGISQLRKLPDWLSRRRRFAENYNHLLHGTGFIPLTTRPHVRHAYHLYVGRLPLSSDRKTIFQYLRDRGIGVNVHYLPVYLHPYYRKNLGITPGLCPTAEKAYEQLITLPLHHGMDEVQVKTVAHTLQQALVAA